MCQPPLAAPRFEKSVYAPGVTNTRYYIIPLFQPTYTYLIPLKVDEVADIAYCGASLSSFFS